MGMKYGFLQRAQDFKPILCRLLARHPYGAPLTTDEIAERSNLPAPAVETISWAVTWRGIDLPAMQAFITACDVNFESVGSMQRTHEYLRNNPPFKHLRRAPNWRTYYLPMFLAWRRSYPAQLESDNPTWPPIRKLAARWSKPAFLVAI